MYEYKKGCHGKLSVCLLFFLLGTKRFCYIMFSCASRLVGGHTNQQFDFIVRYHTCVALLTIDTERVPYTKSERTGKRQVYTNVARDTCSAFENAHRGAIEFSAHAHRCTYMHGLRRRVLITERKRRDAADGRCAGWVPRGNIS